MGFYLPGPNHGKAQYLIKEHGAVDFTLCRPQKFEEIPDDQALVVVVDNGPFEAAGLVYNSREFEEFTRPGDRRPRQFLLMEREKAYQLAGFDG